MFEKYKDSLPIIDFTNPFLNMNKVTIEELSNLINHKLWIRVKNDDSSVLEFVDTLVSVNKDNNSITFNDRDYLTFEDIVGIEDLNNNYNEGNIDFKSYIGKMVKITNKNNDSIECVIQYVDDELITFAVRLANHETLSYDLEYPIYLIKTVDEINN